jgi:hypothetical protein
MACQYFIIWFRLRLATLFVPKELDGKISIIVKDDMFRSTLIFGGQVTDLFVEVTVRNQSLSYVLLEAYCCDASMYEKKPIQVSRDYDNIQVRKKEKKGKNHAVLH